MKKNVMAISGALIASAAIASPAFASTYTVKSGDNLTVIARLHATTAEALKRLNNLTSDAIFTDQVLKVSEAKTKTPMPQTITLGKTTTSTYSVVAGDSLIGIANKHNITLAELKVWNNLTDSLIFPRRKLIVAKSKTITKVTLPKPQPSKPAAKPAVKPVSKPAQKPNDKPEAKRSKPASTPNATPAASQHIVKSGDSLWKIANHYGMSVHGLIELNKLANDSIFVGQALKVSGTANSKAPASAPAPAERNTAETVNKGAYAVVETATSLLGVPYSWAGASPSGFDCSGFIYYVYKQAGYEISRVNSSTYFDLGKQTTSPQPGDMVFFYTNPANKFLITHMGIYLGNDQFIHASSSNGIEINSLNASYYKQRFAGFKKL
ncbi:peptidoglycan endopeptidase [Bacillus sp. M6-12]|uniref:C40 family peptidase n=1 Tax=Bacillus sp. M6-12 TaxID=2054166 RepID=UPI000C793358|nr:C40 family peptidase [Bacillus sp. M6-12]PLS17848.1 peptidoglycan endopeptidase [Bacillus sp. M6-12]